MFALFLAACGTPETQHNNGDGTTSCMALACADAGSNPDDGGAGPDSGDEPSPDAGNDTASTSDAADSGDSPTLSATESNEADILYGWVAAGQPTEERVEEIVATGATIISLRLESEDPFDEPGLIDSLGGTFIRYPTRGSDYDDVDFREGMYDLYDEQLEAGNIVYLHCASSNRVGASWALYQAERKDVPPEEAIEMGKDAGLSSLEDRVREILGLQI